MASPEDTPVDSDGPVSAILKSRRIRAQPDPVCFFPAFGFFAAAFFRPRVRPFVFKGMHMSSVPLTRRGAEALSAELDRLKRVERPAVIQAIAEARAQGDLSENAEYDAARERQGFVEGRIAELEGKLSNAQIIDPAELDAEGRVVFGATVELEELESGKQLVYQIVGEDEADIKEGRVSVTSPVARALIGKSAGDVAEVQAPGGVREYEILGVRYI